jgi:Fe-Mn family superoxide dismutase
MVYQLPPLPYAYDALEPYIDAQTMQLHHDQHHQAYVDNLNAALQGYPQFDHMTIEELLRHIQDVPETIRTVVRNQGGGHANHQLFWKLLRCNNGAVPTGELADAIRDSFGSFEQFKATFEEAGLKHFGSGWVFLVVDPLSDRLQVFSRPDQDSVLLEHKPALLANDVWEHAYYLNYQNRRADYLRAWWNVVDWDVVTQRLEGIRAGKSQL